MPLLPAAVSRFLENRGAIRSLHAIAEALTEQNTLLRRIADEVAPIRPPTASPADLAQTGVSFSRDAEQAAILDYTAQFTRTKGRMPSEDEILEWLETEYADQTPQHAGSD